MIISKPLKINIKKTKKTIICGDSRALSYVIGTQTAAGNLHLFKIKKENNKFIVPIEIVQERLETLKQRLEELEEKISIIKQVLR